MQKSVIVFNQKVHYSVSRSGGFDTLAERRGSGLGVAGVAGFGVGLVGCCSGAGEDWTGGGSQAGGGFRSASSRGAGTGRAGEEGAR